MTLNIQDQLSIVVPLVALGGFMWRHFDNKFEKIDVKIDVKISTLESNLNQKIADIREKLNSVEEKLTS